MVVEVSGLQSYQAIKKWIAKYPHINHWSFQCFDTIFHRKHFLQPPGHARWREKNRAGVCCVCCAPSDNVVLLLRAGKKNCFHLQWKPLNRHPCPVVDARVCDLEKMEERRKKNTVPTFLDTFIYIYIYTYVYIYIYCNIVYIFIHTHIHKSICIYIHIISYYSDNQYIWNIWFPLNKKNYASKSLVHSPQTTHLEKNLHWRCGLRISLAFADGRSPERSRGVSPDAQSWKGGTPWDKGKWGSREWMVQ